MTTANLDVLQRARELAQQIPGDLAVIEIIGPGPDHEDYAHTVIELLDLLGSPPGGTSSRGRHR